MDNLSFWSIEKKKIWVYAGMLALFLSIAVFGSNLNFSKCDEEVIPESELETGVNMTLGESVESYAGIFSMTVTNSVNPSATLALLSIIGTMEKAQQYAPNSAWLNKCADWLNAVPFVRTAKLLPIANPACIIIFTLITVILYGLRSVKVTKAVSQATIDQLEQWGGMLVSICLALLPIFTSQVVEAATQSEGIRVTWYTKVAMIVMGVVVAIAGSVAYYAISQVVASVEVLAAALPIQGANIVVEIVKAVLHVFLTILMFISPFISLIVALILMVICVFVVRKLTILATYYKYIYLKPILKAIFHKSKKLPLVHKKYARKKAAKIADVKLAIPAFSMNRIGKIKKRRMAWLVVEDDVPKLIKVNLIKVNEKHILSELNKKEIYLEKTFRFTRIRTEDKDVEILISNEYSNQWEEMLSLLQLNDYVVVKNRIRAEKTAAKEARNAERMAARAQREEERAARQMQRLESKWEQRLEALEIEMENEPALIPEVLTDN